MTTRVDTRRAGRIRVTGWRPLEHFTGRSVLGLLTVLAAGVAFGLLLLLVETRWTPLYAADGGISAALNARVAPSPSTVAVLEAISRLGGRPVMLWLVVAALVLLVVRRRTRLAVFLAVAGLGALVLDPSVKTLVGRLRPVVEDPVATAPGNSFPSGHALGSMVVYGALLLIFLPALHRRWKAVAAVAAGLLVFAVGFTRIALGVHFVSDVLGGWLLGAAWLGVTAHAFRLWRLEVGKAVAPVTAGLEPEAAADLEPAADEEHLLTRPWLSAAEIVTGWVLVFGTLYAVGMLVSYRIDGTWVNSFDTAVVRWLAEQRTPVLNDVSHVWSKAGDTHAILLVSLLFCPVGLAFWRRWRPVLFIVLTMFGELSLFLAASAAVDRKRPPVEHLDGVLPTASFPSGHIAATMCLYTAIALLVVPRVPHWSRWIPVVLAVVMPVGVALSRMYRGMHHPTDVFGALLLTVLWIGVLWFAVRPNSELTETERGTARS